MVPECVPARGMVRARTLTGTLQQRRKTDHVRNRLLEGRTRRDGTGTRGEEVALATSSYPATRGERNPLAQTQADGLR